ncbi:MAG: hypothetical protein COU47_04325 [Candidatus Niyogibacteria bacterium CG10_big_fil_rev_8_21_14_0_10_46_36]|uniref:Glycosyltransferase RgtA/B/C/D-like domain-containing protein n=1 Tax=Candidatus Niyogibacteria bacterium CG10_big_fil_rev_8_21_14_0_10_46_36 TaxID=1974726 RepID=A0A2H0TCK4_9BACT|nr:MAG: hypothetical protein COU47_04325 [Candidatus Niyogibacteria bacterium CG10_big_fil_rev_8_21_14_0_10_46_36]
MKSFFGTTITIATVCIMFVVLVLGVRGLPGNVNIGEMNWKTWIEDGPFETSSDRARFVLTYSFIEEQSTIFSLDAARFAVPDLGMSSSGDYVSLFAPGVSFLVIPGYIVGKFFGASQAGTYAVIMLFAFLNALLLRAIAIRLGAHPIASHMGALAFLFASPAFAYAVALYQHHVSLFLILASLYIAMRWKGVLPAMAVLFLYGVGFVVDNPNAILMLPILLYTAGQFIYIAHKQTSSYITIRFVGALALAGVILPLIFFAWFNNASYGAAFSLPGTFERVVAIDEFGYPTESDITKAQGLSDAEISGKKDEKSVVGFFKTRNLLNGFYIHLISPDRGMINFAPVLFLGIVGLFILYRRQKSIARVLVGICGLTFILYSLWGDPWGGWAFGSRYLIPIYAILGIGVAVALTRFRKNYIFVILFLALFSYSVWVNVSGAITTNLNPPQVEVLALEEVFGTEIKYTHQKNFDALKDNKSKSFVFQTVAKRYMSAATYHRVLVGILIAVMLLSMLYLLFVKRVEIYDEH